MKKLMSILACVMCAASLLAAGIFIPINATVPAGRTDVTNVYDFATLGKAPCGEIDQIVISANGANTGAVRVALFDAGAVTNILNVGVTATNTPVYLRPTWSDSLLAHRTNQCFNARKVRVIIYQPSNGAAQRWDGAIFVK